MLTLSNRELITEQVRKRIIADQSYLQIELYEGGWVRNKTEKRQK